MRKFILILFCSLPLYAVQPRSETLGMIQTDVNPDSITAIALSAASEEYTEDWLNEYAADKIAFGEAYSSFLSSSLPLENPIASAEKNGAVTLKSLSDGTIISFVFQDGRIAAVSPSP